MTLVQASGPLLRLLVLRRRHRGKEIPQRIGERFGHATRERPHGRVVWCHAASVGESQSVLPLLDRLLSADPALSVLMTTGTVTSADLLSRNGHERLLHQFAPLDNPAWIDRFLDHWRPDGAIWVESELWPSTLQRISVRNIPAILVNARLSVRSFRRWQRMSGFFRRLIGTFVLVLPQDGDTAERFRKLGASRVGPSGNLKFAASPLGVDEATLSRFRHQSAGRPIWVLASSHPGEELLALEAHKELTEDVPKLLTIIVPRHPERGRDILDCVVAAGLNGALASVDDGSTAETDILIGDTLGDLGLYYRFAHVAVMGGSFVPIGGHNPLEPARLERPVLIGPFQQNFREMLDGFRALGGVIDVRDGRELVRHLRALLTDSAYAVEQGQRAFQAASEHADILDRVVERTQTALSLPRGALT